MTKLTPAQKRALQALSTEDIADPKHYQLRKTLVRLQEAGLARWMSRAKVWRITPAGKKALAPVAVKKAA